MKVNAKSFPLRIENIDTDQIIPAQFLKQTEKTGLGKSLFFNWRYLPDGKPNMDFILNHEERAGGEIIIAGNNFGCGSSREHAPWSLADYGIRAIISTQFAVIFKNNSFYNGIIPIELTEDELEKLMVYSEQNPEKTIDINLEAQQVTVDEIGFTATFEVDAFKKECLMNGLDETQYLINLRPEIELYESKR